jgi:hypothetical protein
MILQRIQYLISLFRLLSGALPDGLRVVLNDESMNNIRVEKTIIDRLAILYIKVL